MQEKPEIPTLADVAKAAGVSTATVSRCLNAGQKVSSSTRERVMQAVDELGYTPNFGARAMATATKRTKTMGAIIPTMANAIFAQGLQAFQETLHEHGYTCLVSSTGYQQDIEAEQIRNLVARGADGLLLIGHARSEETYAYLTRRKVPFVISWAHIGDQSHTSIGFDNRRFMSALAQEVFGRGHRNIAIISGKTQGNDRASERVAGIYEAARSWGLDPQSIPIVETAYGLAEGAQALDHLLQASNRPTAVLCGNDVLAVGAVQRANELGLRVPQDISITGFDDIEIANIISPALTTVHVPHAEMGRRAALELISIVSEDRPGVSHELPCSIVLRESLGPC